MWINWSSSMSGIIVRMVRMGMLITSNKIILQIQRQIKKVYQIQNLTDLRYQTMLVMLNLHLQKMIFLQSIVWKSYKKR